MSVLLAEFGDVVPAPDPEAEADRAAALLALVNRDRAALGVRALRTDPQLLWVSQWRSEDQAARRYIGHTFPEGGTVADVLRDLGGPNSWAAAELLWSCAAWLECSAATIRQTFMDSPEHRAILEDGRYSHIGIGLALDVDGHLVVVLLLSDWPE